MIDPSDGKPFAAIAFGTAEDIDRAVRAAAHARDGIWGRLRPRRRAASWRGSGARFSITRTSSR